MTKNKMEYVASGCSFLRITYPSLLIPSEYQTRVLDCFKSTQGKHNHHFSLLYNAYAEKNYPTSLNMIRAAGGSYKTHADSGGLQIITQGATITDELKKKIYENQALHSDIAMSFDEIPIVTVGQSSKRGDMSTRFFDHHGFVEKALQSAKNITDQLRYFVECKTTSKPLMIIHGNSFDSGVEWANIMLNNIPQELIPYLGGIAMGGGSFGNGEKEMMIRTAVATAVLKQHPEIPQYVHFLGIGSVRMFFAAFFLRNNGWMEGIDISYDSTTHTSKPHMGDYLNANCENIAFGKEMNIHYEHMLGEIKEVFPWVPYNLEQYYEAMRTSAGKYSEKHGNDHAVVECFVASILRNIQNFTAEVQRCDNDTQHFLERWVDTKDWQKYRTFGEVKSGQDFKLWNSEFGNSFKSKKLEPKPTNLLDFCF